MNKSKSCSSAARGTLAGGVHGECCVEGNNTPIASVVHKSPANASKWRAVA